MTITRKGDWMQTYTGKAFWPLDPRADEVCLEDIAHALANQCRYAGHTNKFYSVAQQSVHISQAVSSEFALWGLLHDASEAYLVDVPKPLKPFLTEYKAFERNVMAAVCEHFGLDTQEPHEVKAFDTRILLNEQQALMPKMAMDWDLRTQPIEGLIIDPWPPHIAKELFLYRAKELLGL